MHVSINIINAKTKMYIQLPLVLQQQQGSQLLLDIDIYNVYNRIFLILLTNVYIYIYMHQAST